MVDFDPRRTLNSVPVVGGIFSSIFGDPDQEAKQKAMAQARQAIMSYRPEALQAHLNAMGNESAAFGPMQQLMGQMYGPGAQIDMSKLIGNPFSVQEQTKMSNDANPQQRQRPVSGPQPNSTGSSYLPAPGREGKRSWER